MEGDFDFDFSLQLSQAKSPTREELRSLIEEISHNPSPKLFWYLSRLVRISKQEDIKAVMDILAKTTNNHRDKYLGAAFANAHLLRAAHYIGQNDSYKWCKAFAFTNNPLIEAQLYNIIAQPTYGNAIPARFALLNIDNFKIQQAAAAAIARSAKSPTNLLRRTLITLADIHSTELEKLALAPVDDKYLQQRGLVMVASYLVSQPIAISEYTQSLYPILSKVPENETQTSLCQITQKLLARLVLANPVAFHHSNDIFEIAKIQNQAGNLIPEFVHALLSSFGYSAVRRLVLKLIPNWIDTIHLKGLKFLTIVAPFAHYLEADAVLDIQKALVKECQKRLFDRDLFETTTVYMLTSHPTQCPYCGEFLEVLQKTHSNYHLIEMITSVIEPKAPPILNPKRELMKVKEIEKRDTFTQSRPQTKQVLLQCDLARDIKPTTNVTAQTTSKIIAPVPRARTVVNPIELKNSGNQATVTQNTVIDFDEDLDIDANPDSDDE